MLQLTRVEEVKSQSNKVTLASPIQNLWFILFDRSSGRQSPLTVEPSRNSEDDMNPKIIRLYLLAFSNYDLTFFDYLFICKCI